MRNLVLTLLMLNLLYLLWAVLRPVPPSADTSVERRFGESLVLLDEIGRGRLVAVPVPAQEPAVCPALGPFASESELQDFADVHLAGRRWRMAVDELALPSMYRVFVPASDDGLQGAAMLTAVRDEIDSADFDIDSYLVVGGELNGVVSLGVFAGQNNARRVHEQVSGLGIDVEMQTESRVRSVYSIVIADDEDSDFIQESLLALQSQEAEAGITEKLCEMIALPD